jgi:hypothetical protein
MRSKNLPTSQEQTASIKISINDISRANPSGFFSVNAPHYIMSSGGLIISILTAKRQEMNKK